MRATDWVVVNALLDQFYSTQSLEMVPARIDAIWNGDLQALASIVDIGKSSYPWLMRLALWCNEEVPFEDQRRVAADLRAHPEFAGVDQATIPLGLCAAAGIRSRPPASENEPVSSDVPFLIFSGQFDPAVPPSLHRAMVRHLPHSNLVLFAAGAHGAGFTRCGGQLIERFLEQSERRTEFALCQRSAGAGFLSRPPMTPAARLQAAIEVLDEVIASALEEGPPADTIITRYFKHRRYAGSKDRRAVRELVFRAIRRTAERPPSGRALMLGLNEDDPEISELFGEPRGPEPICDAEAAAPAGHVPAWLIPELSPLLQPDEWPALLERAPLDLRVNSAKTTRNDLLEQLPTAVPTPLSPWGLRLPFDSRIDDHPAFESGLLEVQDEGSQMIALACGAKEGDRILDLCAGAGGKALALAAAEPAATILATDSNRVRLSKLAPRAQRAGREHRDPPPQSAARAQGR